ncbi:MAG: hypothetical protein K2L87_03515, partial [Clostridiales bacterium]|nr:hypothetical protein [Clostridiales bacterium]
MDDILLEPLKAYTDVYEQNFEQNAKAYLDELVKSSGVDEALNRQTVERYAVAAKKNADHRSRLSRLKALNVFCIVIAVIAAVAALIAAFTLSGDSFVPVLILILGILLAVALILVSFLVLKPKIKLAAADAEASAKEAEGIKAEAWQQMAPLNSMFEDTATKQLIEKTVPLLQIDDNFDMRRYDYLRGKYGLGENDDIDSSTIEILSGEILGNPFVVDRELVHRHGIETYHGSLVITWTTSYTDSKGNHHTQTHTQTLHASVEKPKPFYSERTRLIYGNEAAPDLHFTHAPSHAERLSEAQAEKRVRSGAKKIQRRQERAIKDGSSFTEMANEAFDVFFGALDRDHEVQFRLLFTPLAQKNMLELMRSTRGFGDDFTFRKSGCLNYISSEHSASWDMNTAYSRYASYDLNQIRNNFLSFNRAYFRSLYFDLAPLLSIPLYQQHKPKEYIYRESYERNYTSYEAECAVNRVGVNAFPIDGAATR